MPFLSSYSHKVTRVTYEPLVALAWAVPLPPPHELDFDPCTNVDDNGDAPSTDLTPTPTTTFAPYINPQTAYKIAATANGSLMFLGTPIEHPSWLEGRLNPYINDENYLKLGLQSFRRNDGSYYSPYIKFAGAFPRMYWPEDSTENLESVPDLWSNGVQPAFGADFAIDDTGRYLVSLVSNHFQVFDAKGFRTVALSMEPLCYGFVYSAHDQITGTADDLVPQSVTMSGDGTRVFWLHTVPGGSEVRVYHREHFTYRYIEALSLPFDSSGTRMQTNTTGTQLIVTKAGEHARFAVDDGGWGTLDELTFYDHCLSADVSENGVVRALAVEDTGAPRIVVQRLDAGTWVTEHDELMPDVGTVFLNSLSVGGLGTLIAVGCDCHVADTSPGYLLLLRYSGSWSAQKRLRSFVSGASRVVYGTSTFVTKDEKTIYTGMGGDLTAAAYAPSVEVIRASDAGAMPVFNNWGGLAPELDVGDGDTPWWHIYQPTALPANSTSARWFVLPLKSEVEVWIQKISSFGEIYVYDNLDDGPILSLTAGTSYTEGAVGAAPGRRMLYIASTCSGSTAGPGLDVVPNVAGGNAAEYEILEEEPT